MVPTRRKTLTGLAMSLAIGATSVAMAGEVPSQLDKAKTLIGAFETGDRAALDVISDETYIQHDLNFPQGEAAIAGFFSGESTGIAVEIVRGFSDGDFVVLHSRYGGDWNGARHRWPSTCSASMTA